MRALAVLVLRVVAMGSWQAPVSDWQPLFDGKTLTGWHPSERPESWKVEDGAIVTSGDRSHLFYVGPMSAKATAWILLSYLRSVLAYEDEGEDEPPAATEWLIYSLRPIAGEAEEIRTRCSLLTPEQVAVLLAMFEYWKKNASWREYCAEDIDAALAFMSTMRG